MGILRTTKFILNHPLNRGQKAAALSRFLRWQLASRILSKPTVLPFVQGTSLLTELGMTGATGNWYCGLHEEDEMAFVLHSLRPDDLFVDVGANIGSYTVLAGGAVGAKVVAFEPHPETFRRLQSNIAINSLSPNVEAHQCGVSDQSGEIAFSADKDTMNRVMGAGESGAKITVEVKTLDEVLEGRVPIAMKVDVEGHEMAVLRGAKATLSNPALQAVLMETNGSGEKYGFTDEGLITAMAEFGFRPFSYSAENRSINARRDGDSNTIFLRDADLTVQRCKSAQSYSLINGTI